MSECSVSSGVWCVFVGCSVVALHVCMMSPIRETKKKTRSSGVVIVV